MKGINAENLFEPRGTSAQLFENSDTCHAVIRTFDHSEQQHFELVSRTDRRLHGASTRLALCAEPGAVRWNRLNARFLSCVLSPDIYVQWQTFAVLWWPI